MMSIEPHHPRANHSVSTPNINHQDPRTKTHPSPRSSAPQSPYYHVSTLHITTLMLVPIPTTHPSHHLTRTMTCFQAASRTPKNSQPRNPDFRRLISHPATRFALQRRRPRPTPQSRMPRIGKPNQPSPPTNLYSTFPTFPSQRVRPLPGFARILDPCWLRHGVRTSCR
ncbi:hypothetical protein IQ06DRAFT_289619 [Phaeosphaeriaceae sp. SRC1lsM3a]|nr:hypothetical protein IQ06DRAFT_289619 [Stagonospora sp. SRC1lsM3a]